MNACGICGLTENLERLDDGFGGDLYWCADRPACNRREHLRWACEALAGSAASMLATFAALGGAARFFGSALIRLTETERALAEQQGSRP